MRYSKILPVVSNILIGPQTYKLSIQDEQIATAAHPGQFAQLKPHGLDVPLLKRPISIANVDSESNRLDFIYRVLGNGTNALAQLKEYSPLEIIAPLGKGFSLSAKKPLLVGGGVGIAPLIYLVGLLCSVPTQVLLAGRNSSELFWQAEFKNICQNIHLTTDDGSLGVQGTALTILPRLLQDNDFDFIYTCGPAPMMRGVAEFAEKYNIPCEASLEKYMACGIGACLSCSCINNLGQRVKVCTDGPVFPASEVIEW